MEKQKSTPEDILAEAARQFYLANISSKNPSKSYSKQIRKLLMEYFSKTLGGGGDKKVSICRGHLYTLIHQAVQTLP